MAYLQARSGIARAGVTYVGVSWPTCVVYINSTARRVMRRDFKITQRADGSPDVFEFWIRDSIYTPVVGNDIKVTYATPNDYLFGGTLTARTIQPMRPGTTHLVWHCVAIGYRWLMDRYEVALAQYYNRGYREIVSDLLARYTDGGFRVGYIPSAFGNITIGFDLEPLSDCLDRLAKSQNALWEVTAERIVNMYTSYPDAALPTITQANASRFGYTEDLSQIRTRVRVRGIGTAADGRTASGATILAVEDTSVFPAIGTVQAGTNIVSYTSLSTSSGPGNLLGCAGIVIDIESGTPVNLLVTAIDAAKQASLATRLGGGLSGQATHVISEDATSSEATNRATSDLGTFGTPLPDVNFSTKFRYLKPGRPVTISVTDPASISETLTIQEVTITPSGMVQGAIVDVWRHALASRYVRQVVPVLQQLERTIR